MLFDSRHVYGSYISTTLAQRIIIKFFNLTQALFFVHLTKNALFDLLRVKTFVANTKTA